MPVVYFFNLSEVACIVLQFMHFFLHVYSSKKLEKLDKRFQFCNREDYNLQISRKGNLLK